MRILLSFIVIFLFTTEANAFKLKNLLDKATEDLGNKLNNKSNNSSLSSSDQQNIQNNTQAPQGTEKIDQSDIINVNFSEYSSSPSDPELSGLNFNMSRDEVVSVLKNNGCKILASWKRRVITKGQKDSRDLKNRNI